MSMRRCAFIESRHVDRQQTNAEPSTSVCDSSRTPARPELIFGLVVPQPLIARSARRSPSLLSVLRWSSGLVGAAFARGAAGGGSGRRAGDGREGGGGAAGMVLPIVARVILPAMRLRSAYVLIAFLLGAAVPAWAGWGPRPAVQASVAAAGSDRRSGSKSAGWSRSGRRRRSALAGPV